MAVGPPLKVVAVGSVGRLSRAPVPETPDRLQQGAREAPGPRVWARAKRRGAWGAYGNDEDARAGRVDGGAALPGKDRVGVTRRSVQWACITPTQDLHTTLAVSETASLARMS
eukprot:5697030-Heterocapsa_arctica.AAC.1